MVSIGTGIEYKGKVNGAIESEYVHVEIGDYQTIQSTRDFPFTNLTTKVNEFLKSKELEQLSSVQMQLTTQDGTNNTQVIIWNSTKAQEHFDKIKKSQFKQVYNRGELRGKEEGLQLGYSVGLESGIIMGLVGGCLISYVAMRFFRKK